MKQLQRLVSGPTMSSDLAPLLNHTLRHGQVVLPALLLPLAQSSAEALLQGAYPPHGLC